MNKESFGSVLKRLRLACKLSQGQVCEKLKLSQQRLSSWETDKAMPASDALLKLLELYNVEDVLYEFGFEKEEYELITPTKQELELIYTLRHYPSETVESFYNLLDLVFKINHQQSNKTLDQNKENLKYVQNKFLIAASGAEEDSDEVIDYNLELAKQIAEQEERKRKNKKE